MTGQRILLPAFIVEFPLNPKQPIIIIPTILIGPRGERLIQMILDTGASFTMVAPGTLIEIGCDPNKNHQNRPITTASGIEYVPFLTIPNMKALGVERENIEVCVHSLPPNIPARGLLGLNFLRHFNVHLNFLQGTLIISE